MVGVYAPLSRTSPILLVLVDARLNLTEYCVINLAPNDVCL